MPRISALPAATSVALGDEFPIVQGATTKRLTFLTAQAQGLFDPANNSITTIKIQDNAVTSDKLSASPSNDPLRAVTINHIRDLAISTAKLQDASVTTPKLADAAVTNAKIGSNELYINKFNPTDRIYLQNAGTARPGGSVVVSGFVKNIQVWEVGSGYNSGNPPVITIDAPPAGGTQATATATFNVGTGAVTSVTITNEGSGYTSTPNVTFNNPTLGTTAKAYAYTVVNGCTEQDPMHINLGTQHGSFNITTDRKVKVYGYNGYGQLGVGYTQSNIYGPQEIVLNTTSNNPPMPVKIYPSGGTTWFIDENGGVWATGYNGYGQCGNGTTGYVYNGFIQIAQGYFGNKPIIKLAVSPATSTDGHSVAAMTADGYLYTWGYNGYGQLGINNVTSQSTPQPVPGTGTTYIVRDVIWAGAWSTHNLVILTSTGRVFACGYNGHGSLTTGNTTQQNSLVPFQTAAGTPLTNVTQIHGNGNYPHIAALSGGLVYTAGYNGYGELGHNGTTSTSSLPAANRYAIAAGGNATNIVSIGGPHGYYGCHICIRSDGKLSCWGYNGYGHLGNGTSTSFTTPAQTFTATSSPVVKTATVGNGTMTSILLTQDGSIYGCGYDGYGQLGDYDNSFTSSQTTWTKMRIGRSDIVAIRWCGYGQYAHPEVLTSDGKVYNVGYGGNGDLGRNDQGHNRAGISNVNF